uniref:Bipolar kinesin krp-like protein n=1 Tax=Crithidia mellificae TaxID=796356 RepID=V9LTT3_CRIME|nr:bipolar kinesin krp-like protein [Crithidia mellificae]
MTSANSHVRFTVEDEDAGRRYSFSLDNQQYQRLTVAQVQRMVIEASRDASPSASTMTTKQVAGTPVKHHIGTLSYESAIVTLRMKAAQHAPSLLPGSFALLDTNKHALLDGNARAATHMDLHRNTPFYVVRNHHHYQHQRSPSNSSVLFVEEPPTRILSAVSSSAVSFVVNSDGDEEEENTQTDGSVSFQEDVVSMTYEALMPSENITSPVQSVQFETEEEEDRTIEFDTISFATVDSVLTAEQRSSAAVQGETAVAGTPGSQKATTISNPVASMTVRQRFEYYQTRGKRKKVAGRPTAHATTTTRTRATTTTTTAAASLPASTHVTHRKVSTAAVPGPAVTSATAPRSTNAHSSVAPPTEPSVSTTTISRKMKRKPVVPRTEKCQKQQQPAEAIDAPTAPFLFSGQAAATTATEREMKLVVLVQQLQEDVEKLLVQSQSDVSRIAALRRALTETRKEYLALREAHCSSLNQLNAYAAQIASGVLPIRQQDEEPREGEKSHTVTAAAGVSMPDVVVKQQEQQQQQQEQRQDSLHEEEVGVGVSAATMSGEVPEEEGKQKDDETEEKSQQTAPANTLGASHGDDKAAGVTEAPSTTPAPQEPELHIVTDNSQEESEQTQQMIQQQPTSAEETPVEEDNVAAEGAVPSESAAEGAVPSESAAEGAVPSAAPTHESRQPFIRPIPALLHFTNEEARVLLRQIGYIYHNRLLRRENALLMCQLQLLKDQAKTNKMCRGAGNVQRLRVVVRIRPVGLASALPTAEARRDSVLRVASPVALTPPSSHSQHRNSAQVTSPKEHSVEEDPNPPYASSVVSPLSSHYSASFISKERATTAAGMPTAPGDVFLQCNFGDNRLQVHNPEIYVNNSTSTTTAAMIARDSSAVLRGVRIIGPPLPQSLFSVSATATSAVQALESSSASTLLHSVTEDQGETSGLALRAAAAVQQRRLYEEVVAPLVAGALRGESGTVLAYGQVGSGKTYTMFGRCGVSSGEDGEGGSHAESKSPVVFGELPAEAGVVPRALADLFDQLRDKAASEELLLRSLYASRYDMAFQATINMKASSKDATAAALSEASLANLVALSCVPMCEVQCSMLELYNDRVRDLLAPKIEVPRYEESLTATTGVKGNPEYRSSDSSAERRTQWQLRQAQAAQLGQRESTVDSDVEQRRPIGCEYIVPECAVRPCVDGSARVDGATRVTVHNMCEALQLLERGLANRETHETALNAQSSRSHVILTVTIKQQQWCGEEAAAATVDVAAPATTGEEMETDVSAEDASVAAKKSQRMKGSATTTKNKAATATVKKATKKSETKSKTTAKATAAAAPADTAMTGATPVERQRKGPTQEVSTDDSAVKITTAAEMEEQEDKAQDKYLRCRSVKSVTSQLVFIDLAGTGQGTGELFSGKAERLREAQAIGKSLAALGDVMSALYGGSGVARAAKPAAAGKATATAFSGSAAHVPFRSHRLTMLLRNALVKPTACVVLACVALSERPMAALLADTVPLASNCSASAQSNSLASQAPLLAEQQYWRLATERLMAAQCAKSTTETAAATGSASSVASPTTVSRRPSTRASVRSSIVHNSVFASPSAGQLAGKRKSTSKSTVLSSRRDSASLLDLHKLSIASEEETEESSNRKSVSQQESSPAVQHVAANVTIDAGAAQEPSVDSEFVAQMTAIQANADAEDRAVSGALWITPRETVSTLAFLSRLWKA